MPSHRPTLLGTVVSPGNGDDEAPTRSGFAPTTDEERTAVNDRVARSLIGVAARSEDEGWENKPTVAGNSSGDVPARDIDPADFADDGTGGRAADGSKSRKHGGALGAGGGRAPGHEPVAPGTQASAPAAALTGFSVDRLTAPSTVVDGADRSIDDEVARPLPSLAVGAGRADASIGLAGTAPPAALLVIGGNDRGRRFEVGKSLLTVGRAVDNDVVLTDISVSRHHLAIAFDGQRFIARDLGSGNGTLINQRERAEAALCPGDQLELGNTLFRFEAESARAGGGRPVLELGDDQSTVAERPRGVRAAGADPTIGEPRVPHVSAAAITSTAAESLEPAGGAGSISQITPRVAASADRGAPSTDSVVAAAPDVHRRRRTADPTDRRFRRRIYLAAVLFGLIVALAVAGGTGDPTDDSFDDSSAALVTDSEAIADLPNDATRPALSGRSQTDGGGESGASADEVANDRATDADDAADDAADDDNDNDNDNERTDSEARAETSGDEAPSASGTDESAPGPATVADTSARRNGGRTNERRDGRTTDRNRATRSAAASARQRQPADRSNAAMDQAADLYKARQFANAAKALRAAASDSPGAAAKKLRAQAAAYEAVGKHLATGDSDKRSNAPGAMVAYRKALSLDRKSGRGIHGTYIRLRLRDVAPRAAGAFMAQKRYEAAKRAADEAVTYGAGADPMVKRVREALSRKADEYYQAGLASRSKNPRLADSNFKRAMSLVPKSDPLHAKARAALQR